MFTINIKGKVNPKDPKMVKLEMIIFKTGYARVSKVLQISGAIKDWENQSQSFKGNSSALISKNKILFDLKNQYLKVAEDWDYEGRVWSPVELSHCFDEVQTRKKEVKSLSILQMIDSLVEKFTHKERYKNGRIVTSANNAHSYKEIKNSLTRFTQEVYNRSFSSYYFKEINERFLLDYTLYIQKIGIENGNKGGLTQKLRRLRATCRYAEKQGIYGVDMKAFECLGDNIKWGATTSKATSAVVLAKLEDIDRSLFSKKEQLHLDLFLFSYYTGGMANVDVCYLTWDSIKEDKIIYERMKFPKQAKPLLIEKAKRIIEKYRSVGSENYIFPVFTHKHNTDMQRTKRISNITVKMTQTLGKASRLLKIKDKLTWYSARASFITRMVDEGYYTLWQRWLEIARW
ncbi:phage integrase SAM-like domain-containing protein [Bacteroides helcogenes]|uniref:Phage integrase SAM-like domain-containing protein n=1 Tax=Bacteroides helcogenes (strain ATCC 35417 / DSM 20613 / JCM 6297 / CCUG 15421 / P 36-108) TaxID=693979 RepID=E6SWS8_BACT6|nr:phage integrase SAM-like domain-containing protein [Bacteroides helcogenes]ADV43630.1 hypothetical protein Bache_1627 [Bacteroides helcogenes P 36-108]MDY5239351.1 phage integrase SAM-like domain-containing protein [Bacteroides helcogenes]